MNYQPKHLFCSLALALMSLGAAAQSYTIYPVPQTVKMNAGSLALTNNVNVVSESTIDDITKMRIAALLQQKGCSVTELSADAFAASGVGNDDATIYLGTVNSGEAVATLAEEQLQLDAKKLMAAGKYDRHAIDVSAKGIVVLGEHTNAVFMGLASIEQMLEQTTEGALPFTTIYDYADQESRGLVEGYYGYPYSVSVKKDLMRYMMRYKMNTYMYGAKSDPYHSQLWRDAYPATISAEQEKNGWLTQDMVSEIAEVSRLTKVNFIWAIHPGNEFLGSSTVVSDVMSKFEKMHALGVRHFGVFVDDVSIPSSDADMKLNAQRLTELQRAIEKKWNYAGAAAADTVRPLHFVPQIYCNSFASSVDQRQRFMKALQAVPDYITVYSTGQGVWSVPNNDHTQTIMSEFGRPMGWWWNYPCNDNADGQIYLQDMYSNFYDLPSVDGGARMPENLKSCQGIVANPMQQGEVSKTSLFSIADYSWNNSEFDNKESWNASINSLFADKDMREAYKYLTYYLRWNEPDGLNTTIETYKESLQNGTPKPDALLKLFAQIEQNCLKVMTLKDSEIEADRLLFQDLAPWLYTLNTRAKIVQKMLNLAGSDAAQADKWLDVKEVVDSIDALRNSTLYTAYALEGMGNGISVSQRQAQLSQRFMAPFVDYMFAKVTDGYFENQAAANQPKAISNSLLLKPVVKMLDDGSAALTMPAADLDVDKWVGIELPQPTLLSSIELDDALLPLVQISTDGKQWTAVENVASMLSDTIKYIVVRNNTDAGIRNFELGATSLVVAFPKAVVPAGVTVPEGAIYEDHGANLIIDGDYSTWMSLNRNQQTSDDYVLDLGETVVLQDVRVVFGTTNGDHPTKARVQYSANGKSWTTLRIKGASASDWTISAAQNVPVGDNAAYCDFNGAQKKARYVRVRITEANTSKWMRLCEIEVNKQYIKSVSIPTCEDATGMAINELLDGSALTRIPETATSPITYRFYNHHAAESLAIYGEDGVQVVALDEGATSYTIAWEGTQPPRIYEVVPAWNKSKSSLPLEGTALAEEFAQFKALGYAALDSCGMGEKLVTSSTQFSSPYTETAEGSINNLLDGNLATFWHSTWKGGSVADGVHYIQIALPDVPVTGAYLSFGRRSTATADHLVKARIKAVLADESVVDVIDLDLPYASSSETLVRRFSLPATTKAVQLVELKTTGDAGNSRGYFHIGELQLYNMQQYWVIEQAQAEADALKAAMQPLPSEATAEQLAALREAYAAFMLKVFGELPSSTDGVVMPAKTGAYPLYDLMGRPLKQAPVRGLYIEGGQLKIK